MQKWSLIIIAIFISVQLYAQQLNVIPYPKTIAMQDGFYTAPVLKKPLSATAPFTQWVQAINKSNVLIKLQAGFSEAYQITIDSQGVQINCDVNSKLLALQTLRQLVENYPLGIPYCKINDEPKMKYRGMHLDVCRHFYTTQEVKQYLEYMARYKMNTFHWHLTDDQGWRIAIQKYPLLTTIGSTRKQTLIGRQTDEAGKGKYDGKIEKGFYTQDEIKIIIAYAKRLGITVIPEIEMPGHSRAAIAAYPFLNCTGKACEVGQRWGVYPEVYCAGQESTFEFLQNVLDEVMQLFPSQRIHIGGDEVVKDNWKKCKHCQARMQKEQLKTSEDLQSYFIQRIEKYVNSKGKSIIGWDEILEGGLAPNATVMSWRGESGGIAAAKENHEVIMTPGSHCYFDHRQSKNINEPLNIGGNTHYTKVYNYQAIPKELQNTPSTKYIIGAQANMWTEYITTFAQIEYMMMPRLQALSEVLWSSANSLQDFQNRLSTDMVQLDKEYINYRIPEPKNMHSNDTLSLSKDIFKIESIAKDYSIFINEKALTENEISIPWDENGFYTFDYYLLKGTRRSIVYTQTFKKNKE
jgi:hexosaminidase